MLKSKNHYFVYFFIALAISLLFTFVLFFALFRLSALDSSAEIIEDHDVTIVKLNNKNLGNFESVNKYLRDYYHYGINQLTANSELVGDEEAFELRAIKESNYFYVDENTKTVEKDPDCTHYTCFDLYHCETHENLIKVYIYPIKNYVVKQNRKIGIVNEFSEQYFQILESIVDSPFYTDNPDRACLFIAPIDTLNEETITNSKQLSQVMNRLKYFNERSGKNHLFFNFMTGDQHLSRLDLGKAMIASAGFDTFGFRQKFDISIPMYSLLSERFDVTNRTLINYVLRKNRKWTLLITQFNLLNKDQQIIVNKFESDPKQRTLLLLTNQCRNHNPTKFRCSLSSKKFAYNYTQILMNSNFCLIIRTKHLASTLLSDSIMYGCIPVIAIDDYVLPFDEKIDWPRFSIRIHEKQLDNLMNLIRAIDNDTLFEMRRQAMLIWKRYFSSIDQITITTLFLINERLFPHTARSRENWNQLKWDLIDNASDDEKIVNQDLNPMNNEAYTNLNKKNRINSSYFYESLDLIKTKPTNLKTANQGFTAVILTYDRMESLISVVRQLIIVSSCRKILIIWNNQQKRTPTEEEFFKLLSNDWSKQIKIPIQIVVTLENKLSNRFYPYHEIETDCVLAIDDDITMLTADELEFTFATWQEFSDRIVGFPSRVHRWDKESNRWRYESEWTNDVSMILTGAAFYHKFYNYLYTFEMPKEIREWVDRNMNCEDIAMNFLVSNITGKAPIKATPRKKFKLCPECPNKMPMLSSNALSHLNKRSECINIFVQIYGFMPLQTVEYRADPVLYKDSLPEKLKRFIQIGAI